MEFHSRRSSVLGQHGCVASSNPLASQAGLDILKLGGNAADAAVAVAAVLNVTEPISTGIGGDAFCMFYNSTDKSVKGINGSGRTSSNTSLESIAAKGFTQENVFSPLHGLTVTVPGAASCWVETVNKFGSGKLSLSSILQPAIDLAKNGFPVHELAAFGWNQGAAKLQRKENVYGESLLLNGEAPKAGQIMTNKDLARTFEELATRGREGFYSGRIAKAIAEVVQQHGGDLTEADLSNHQVTFDQPISVDFKGLKVWELPPNGQGMIALMALNILESLDLKAMGHNSTQYIHHVAESLRLAFADALVHCADPVNCNIPIEEILSKNYASVRRKLIKDDQVIPSKDLRTSGIDVPFHSDTVYFSTSDKWGNACSFINSNFMGFGTGIVPEGCGFTLQNRGFGFSLNEKHKNVIAPSKRPYHTIIPAMVTTADTNELLLSYGVMGGFMQPQGHVQVLLNMAEFGCDPQVALDLPRFSLGDSQSMYTPASIFDALRVEEGIPAEVVSELKSLGHNAELVSGHSRAMFGRGQVISQGSWWRSGLNGRDKQVYWAGSDPRADGLVASY